MAPVPRTVLAVLGSLGGSLFLSVVVVVVVATATSGLSATAVGPWMIRTMWVEGACFLLGVLALPLLLPSELAAPWKVLLTLVVAIFLHLPTAAFVIGANFLIFNR